MVIERMTEQQKRKRVLIPASINGVKRAEKIRVRLGFASLTAFAKSHRLGKSSVDRFFNCQPIQVDTFIKICEGLEVKDWRELAELEPVLDQVEKATPARLLQACLAQDSHKIRETDRQVITARDQVSGEVKAEVTLDGDFDTTDATYKSTIEVFLKMYAGDSIQVTTIRSGSIKVTVQGSSRDIAKLIDQINAGELTEVEGFPIQDCQILSEDFLADVGQHSNAEKWQLIDDIVNNPKIARQLSGADLSDADLSNAILINVDLTNADLSGADLSKADLRALRALLDRLARRDLIALLDRLDILALLDRLDRLDLRTLHNLRDIRDRLDLLALLDILDILDLRDLRTLLNRRDILDRRALLSLLRARLDLRHLRDRLDRSTNLEGADLTDTIVEGCQFGDGVGLSPLQKAYLKRRGGIFNDSPGDMSSVETLSPTRA